MDNININLMSCVQWQCGTFRFCYQCVCETWCLTLRERENKVLRRILTSKREEMMGGWQKLHEEDLHNLYSSPLAFLGNQI
jgi:hypothetical protein